MDKKTPYIFLLISLLIFEIIIYGLFPYGKGFSLIKESLGSVLKMRWNYFLVPKNNINDKIYHFSKSVEKDLPTGSKILYIKDTNDGTDLKRYFMINYMMDGRNDATFNFENNPSEERIVEIMEQTNSDFYLTFAAKIPLDSIILNQQNDLIGKIFKIDGGKLELIKEYK